MNEPRLVKLQEIPVLLDFYGSLLTKKQQQALSLCYEEDFSLAEIAQLHNSSRQAAHDLLERAESLLHTYENNLHLAEKEYKRSNTIARLRQTISELALDDNDKAKIEELLCLL